MLDLVSTSACLGCGRAGEWLELCLECEGEFSGRLKPMVTRNTLCTGAWALGTYSGPIGNLVRRTKFNLDLRAAAVLIDRFGTAMAASVDRAPTAIVPVPTTPWRLMWRGFHLPEGLAEAASRAVGAPIVPCLRRRWGVAQAGRSFAERIAAGGELFSVNAPISGHVLLVDDVLTSGASAHGAAAELLVAGASEVSLAVLAAAGPLRRATVGIS